MGVSGDNTEDLLQRFETEVRARIDEDEKTLILIEIGINDLQFVLADKKYRVSPEKYKQNLLKLIKIAQKYQADLVFVGLTPVDDSLVDPTPWKSGSSYRLEFVQKYEEFLKEISKEENVPFIELMSKFMETDFKSLLTDGLHPNSEGHKIIFEEVMKYLQGIGLI